MYGNEVAIDDVQQYLRRDCLEIVGIPRVPQDNPKQFVQEVGSLIDVDIYERRHLDGTQIARYEEG